MLKNKILVGSVLTTLCFTSNVSPVQALELDEDTRTVTLDAKGNNVVLTPEQVKRGKRLFNNACGTCHVGGLTKTNPNVGLDTESLSLATPPRDNITQLVAYMKEPMTYDGLDSISEFHFSQITGVYNCDTFLPKELIKESYFLTRSNKFDGLSIDIWCKK